METLEETLSRKIPVGLAKPSWETEYTVPTSEVKNIIEWVNSDLLAPFRLTPGEPFPLALFGTLESDLAAKTFMTTSVGHNRSAKLGAIVFRDREGRLYRDVSLKGNGNFTKLETEGMIFVNRVQNRTEGIMNREFAYRDVYMAEELTRAGIRTSRTIAILELEEIIHNGEKISITEAKQRGIIAETDEPVVEIRAFGIHARIRDAYEPQRVRDAMVFVAQELGRDPETFTADEYLEWFAHSIAQSLARLHKKNFVHGYLTSHNITLDARIVDLDSVSTPEDSRASGTEKSFSYDLGEVLGSVGNLFGIIKAHSTRSDLMPLSEYFKSTMTIDRVYEIVSDEYQKEFTQTS